MKLYLVTIALIFISPALAHSACVGLGADERLENHCLVNSLNGATINKTDLLSIDHRLRREGYKDGLGVQGTKPVDNPSTLFSVTPIFRYEDNINGGNSRQPLVVGSLRLIGDENFYKQSGVVVGLNAGLGGRYIYGQGRYLNYNLVTGYAQSFESGIGIVNHNASLCSINHIAKRWNIDACADQARNHKKLLDVTSSNLKLILSHTVSNLRKQHKQLKFGANRYLANDYNQNQLQFAINTTYPQGVFTGLDTTLGEAVNEQLATRFFVAGTIGLYFARKPLKFTASYRRSSGGLLLGFDRDSNTASISATYPVWRNFTATLGYSNTDSNIDYFDASGPSLDVQFAAIQF